MDVADFLGDGLNDLNAEQVDAHIAAVTASVFAYTRGNGFTSLNETVQEPADDLARVIISSVARLLHNPTHTITETTGPFSHRPAVFDGWTLPELAVLHRYRRRLA